MARQTRMKNLLKATLLTLIVCSLPAVAQDLDAGVTASRQGAYATAMAELRPLTEPR
jgi:hypothetical protein